MEKARLGEGLKNMGTSWNNEHPQYCGETHYFFFFWSISSKDQMGYIILGIIVGDYSYLICFFDNYSYPPYCLSTPGGWALTNAGPWFNWVINLC